MIRTACAYVALAALALQFAAAQAMGPVRGAVRPSIAKLRPIADANRALEGWELRYTVPDGAHDLIEHKERAKGFEKPVEEAPTRIEPSGDPDVDLDQGDPRETVLDCEGLIVDDECARGYGFDLLGVGSDDASTADRQGLVEALRRAAAEADASRPSEAPSADRGATER